MPGQVNTSSGDTLGPRAWDCVINVATLRPLPPRVRGVSTATVRPSGWRFETHKSGRMSGSG